MKSRFRYAIPFMILPFLLFGGLVVMLLWNAILPHIVSVTAINYWQATGLLVLSRILFGGFRGGPFGGHRGGPPQWRNRWVNMSDEEKIRFKEEMQNKKEEWKNTFKGEA
jgi:hypothetical protein